MFTYFTKEQFISFSKWLTGAHEFDELKYYAWLNANYDLWHNPTPPIFAINDIVLFAPTVESSPTKGRINAVHLYRNGSKYDIELDLGEGHKARLHNVSSAFLLQSKS